MKIWTQTDDRHRWYLIQYETNGHYATIGAYTRHRIRKEKALRIMRAYDMYPVPNLTLILDGL